MKCSDKKYKDQTYLILCTLRHYLGLPQAEIAKLIGTTQGNYSKIERGDYAGLSGLQWMIICDQFDVRPESIFNEDLIQNIFCASSNKYYSVTEYLTERKDKNDKNEFANRTTSSKRIRTWSNSFVLDLLFRLYSNNEPFYPSYVIKNDYVLHQNAIKRFGTWENALIRANIPQELVVLAVSKKRISRIQCDILEMYFVSDSNSYMKNLATVYFGNIESALANFYQSSDEYKLKLRFGVLYICKRLFDQKGDLNSKVIFKSQIPGLLYAINQKFGGVEKIKDILVSLTLRQEEILSM